MAERISKGEMVLAKTFSASWLMSVIVTVGATIITFWAIYSKSEYGQTALSIYLSNWGIIIVSYFKRDRTQEASNVKTTETKTTEAVSP